MDLRMYGANHRVGDVASMLSSTHRVRDVASSLKDNIGVRQNASWHQNCSFDLRP
jgi:hypothetical protein